MQHQEPVYEVELEGVSCPDASLSIFPEESFFLVYGVVFLGFGVKGVEFRYFEACEGLEKRGLSG